MAPIPIPLLNANMASFNHEELFRSFRYKTHTKARAIELIRGYNDPETPLKDLVDTKEHHCKSLLQWAGIRGWSDVCQLLINDYQCDPFYESEGDWTVLHNVCGRGHIDLVRYFVSKPWSMDPLKKNKDGHTPLDFSKHYGYIDITKYLRSIIPRPLHRKSQIVKSDVRNVLQLLRSKSHDWKEIGRCLGVPVPYMGRLNGSEDSKLERVLLKWVESEYSEVSWNTIIEVLKDLEHMNTARVVEEYLTSHDGRRRSLEDVNPNETARSTVSLAYCMAQCKPFDPTRTAGDMHAGFSVEEIPPVIAAARPDPNDVFILLKSISYNWCDIGRGLGVGVGFRKSLKLRDGDTNNGNLEEIIQEWDQTECSQVSWDTVLDMLEDLKYVKKAREVKKYLLHDSNAKKYNLKGYRKALRES